MRWALAAVLCAGVFVFPSSGTATNGVAMQVLNAAGVEDPVEDVGRTFVFQGHTDTNLTLYVAYRPSGGAPCAPSYYSDSGTGFDEWSDLNGDFRVETARVWPSSGSFLFCMWLAHYSSEVVTPYSRVLSFRLPTGSVSLSTNPAVLRPGVAGTISLTGTSEAPRSVYVKDRPAGGAACAPSPSSDSGEAPFWYGTEVNGAFSLAQTATFDHPGTYMFCVWI